MPAQFFIRPKGEGRIVRDPITRQPLAAAGEPKSKDSYWLRRQDDGDVEECKPPKQTAAPQEGKE